MITFEKYKKVLENFKRFRLLFFRLILCSFFEWITKFVFIKKSVKKNYFRYFGEIFVWNSFYIFFRKYARLIFAILCMSEHLLSECAFTVSYLLHIDEFRCYFFNLFGSLSVFHFRKIYDAFRNIDEKSVFLTSAECNPRKSMFRLCFEQSPDALFRFLFIWKYWFEHGVIRPKAFS